MADEDHDTERRRTLILRKIVCQWNEKEKADNAAVCVAVVQVKTPICPCKEVV